MHNIYLKIKKSLPREVFRILKLAGEIADKKKARAFVVGGFVRDVILGIKNLDIDIVIEGNGPAFAKTLSDRLNGSLVIYERFGTATIIIGLVMPGKKSGALSNSKLRIDVATARQEYYESPAALPTVSFASIKSDLYRRDFTINAMALSLNKETFGELIDFFNGQRDIRLKKIRALHDSSFIDDPTRIFRAVRFEQRYNFTIGPHTTHLIQNALKLDMFGRTEKQRLRNEIILILSEDKPLKALRRMNQLNELRFIHPKIRFSGRLSRLFIDIDKLTRWYQAVFADKRALDAWIIYFMAIVDGISANEASRICDSFVFSKKDESRIISSKNNLSKALKTLEAAKRMSPSAIYQLICRFSHEALIFMMAKTKQRIAKKRIEFFLKRLDGMKIFVTGKDLKALGIKPGPEYKRILNKIFCDKLDGKITKREHELAIAGRSALRAQL